MLLGLTGGYCAGKNSVAELLEKRGWASIDVDRLGHRALELARDEVLRHFDEEARELFGRGLLDAAGKLDRKLLGAIVFSEPRKLAEHEAIIHPVMFALVDERIAALRDEARARGDEAARIVVNAAILYKMPVLAGCDAVIEVRAPLLLRLRRAKARDGLGARRALDRIGRQAVLWRLRPRQGRGGDGQSAPPVLPVWNEGDRARLERRLDSLLDSLGAMNSRGLR
ncbi:MAG TPA: dephospho-CoA kinase [Rectinemataceae bacterium]|nr:dephospho-CoA kinase [Rectinemataceae bacterium]